MKEEPLGERREYPRADATFVVRYCLKGAPRRYDVSKTKNVSRGGVLLTTHRPFEAGDRLEIRLRVPTLAEAADVLADVVGSRQLVRGLIYETRAEFSKMDDFTSRRLAQFVAAQGA